MLEGDRYIVFREQHNSAKTSTASIFQVMLANLIKNIYIFEEARGKTNI